MDSSGLQEMLESIYTPNAVVYMLNGKAIAWAVHVRFVVDTALNALILRRVLNAPLPCQPEISESNDDSDPDIAETADVGNSQYLDEARTFYEKLMSGNICAEEAYSSNVLEKSRTVLRRMESLWRNPPELKLCGFSTWTWSTFYTNLSEQSL